MDGRTLVISSRSLPQLSPVRPTIQEVTVEFAKMYPHNKYHPHNTHDSHDNHNHHHIPHLHPHPATKISIIITK